MTTKLNSTTFAICIGRQFGSGGRAVARQIAQLLDIAYYDKKLLQQAAADSGIAPDRFQAADERAPQFFPPVWPVGLPMAAAYLTGDSPLSDDAVYQAQCSSIRLIASRQSCVIVGRTADYVLRDSCPVLSVFLHAPLHDRAQRIVSRGDCETIEQAEKLADKVNRSRAEYYNFYTDREWGNAQSYDLSIDTTLLGIDDTAKLIAQLARRRFLIQSSL